LAPVPRRTRPELTLLAVRGRTVYVASGAYFTHNDPNLLLASYR
jgi:hypothetical protein